MCKYLTRGEGGGGIGLHPCARQQQRQQEVAGDDTEFWDFRGLKLPQADAGPSPHPRRAPRTPLPLQGCLLGEAPASTDGAQSTVGPPKIESLSGESVRANEVCLWLGIMSNVAGSIIYQRRRLQQRHIHWEHRLAPGRDRSGRRALQKLEALQRSTQQSRVLATKHQGKGVSRRRSEVTPSRSPQQRAMGTLGGRNHRRDRNIARGREVGLLGDGEGLFFFMGIRKCHQHTALKLGEPSCLAKDKHRLAGGSVPATLGGFRPWWGTVLSPASWDTCENILHIQMSLPTAHGDGPLAGLGCGSCRRSGTVGWKDAATISCSGDGGVSPRGGGRAASGLLGQEETTSEQEGFAPRLVTGLPQPSCTLLWRRYKSLLPQGRGQGGWKRSCGSIHVRSSSSGGANGCPTVCVPGGLSPAWAHPGAAAGDGEVRQAPLVAGGPFPSPTLGCLQACFPSPLSPPGLPPPLRFGAVPPVYSKTSRLLNQERGDKETPRAVCHPTRHPRGRSCCITPAGMGGQREWSPRAPPLLPQPHRHTG